MRTSHAIAFFLFGYLNSTNQGGDVRKGTACEFKEYKRQGQKCRKERKQGDKKPKEAVTGLLSDTHAPTAATPTSLRAGLSQLRGSGHLQPEDQGWHPKGSKGQSWAAVSSSRLPCPQLQALLGPLH